MIHIRYKDSSFQPNETYTVVVTDDWHQPLEIHPSLIQHPEWYEIADCEIPAHAQYLIYTPNSN
jgi:hypothetical protein